MTRRGSEREDQLGRVPRTRRPSRVVLSDWDKLSRVCFGDRERGRGTLARYMSGGKAENEGGRLQLDRAVC